MKITARVVIFLQGDPTRLLDRAFKSMTRNPQP